MNATRLTAAIASIVMLAVLAWGFTDTSRDPSHSIRFIDKGAAPFGNASWKTDFDQPHRLKAELVVDGILYKLRYRQETRATGDTQFEVRTFLDWVGMWEILPQHRRIRRVSQERIDQGSVSLTSAVVDEVITADGEVIRRDVKLPPATVNPKIFRALADDMFEALAMLRPRMPQRPVGIGASWVERRDIGIGVGDLFTVGSAIHVTRRDQPILRNPRVPIQLEMKVGGPATKPSGRLLERETAKTPGVDAFLSIGKVKGGGTVRLLPVHGLAVGKVRYQVLGNMTKIDEVGVERTPISLTIRVEVERDRDAEKAAAKRSTGGAGANAGANPVVLGTR